MFWKKACALLFVFVAATAAGLAQTLTPLATFKSTDGKSPTAALVQGLNGSLYGTTGDGGNYPACQTISSNDCCGVIFNFAKGTGLTIFHSFDSTDGAHPVGGLLLTTDGDLYGTPKSPLPSLPALARFSKSPTMGR